MSHFLAGIVKTQQRAITPPPTPQVATPPQQAINLPAMPERPCLPRLDSSKMEDAEIRQLTREDADTIRKQEEAIKLRRNNKLAAKKLVSLDEFKEIVMTHYSKCTQQLNEALDSLFLKHNISASVHVHAWKLVSEGLRKALQETIKELDCE